MPRFYFDVRSDEELAVDDTGHDFADVQVAHREAVRTLAEISAELIPLNGPRHLTIEVRDDQHNQVFAARLDFDPGQIKNRHLR